MYICDLGWPLGVDWLCFDVRCQAVTDLERTLEITESISISRVLALCHSLGIEMIWTVVSDLEVECMPMGIKFEDIHIYALQFMNNNKANLS